jgi:hypothetical protein
MRAAPASGTKRRSSWSPPSAMLLRPARGPQLAGGALRRGHDLTVGDLLKERGASTVIEVGVEALVLFVLDAVVLVAQPIVDGHSHGVPMKPSSARRPTPCSDNCGRIDGRSDGPGSRRRSGCSAIGIQCAGQLALGIDGGLVVLAACRSTCPAGRAASRFADTPRPRPILSRAIESGAAN